MERRNIRRRTMRFLTETKGGCMRHVHTGSACVVWLFWFPPLPPPLPATALIFGGVRSQKPVTGRRTSDGRKGTEGSEEKREGCDGRLDGSGGAGAFSGVGSVVTSPSSRPISTRSLPPRKPRVPPLRQSLDGMFFCFLVFFRPGNGGGSPNSRLALTRPLLAGLLPAPVPGRLPARAKF